ncbi:hypothetical protein KI387_001778, partial [Taxus chinensis]
MSGDLDDRGWSCGGGGAVNLCRVASFVGDRDRRGNARKGPKSLAKGVDPSIRAEVWEFLLGCHALSSTAEYRQQLRMARRERYRELIEQCQMMHSSIGTGSLAYTIGSKVMDVRIMSKDSAKKQAKLGVERITQEAKSKLESSRGLQTNERVEVSYANGDGRPSSTDSPDFGSARENPDDAAMNSFHSMSSAGLDSGVSESEREDSGAIVSRQDSSDFPPLPVTNLFDKNENTGVEFSGYEAILPKEQAMGNIYHSSQTNGEKEDFLIEASMNRFENSGKYAALNIELAQENHVSSSKDTRNYKKEKFTLAKAMVQEQELGISGSEQQLETTDRMKMSDASDPSDTPLINPVVALGVDVNEDRVADWLWTLHRIVVDVVRTDRHLEFYGDAKNMARMSDILAVYAWVDPRTGYCQGMSDLLSPFIILFEDDADAFWCFESLLRRVRLNFQMEGPVGVMKQLETLGRILQLTDLQLFKHLALVGADSLLFAFRMLLVLFRRELSFNDALCMWEMMWAADFDEAMAWALENNCLEALVLRPPKALRRGSYIECDEGTPHSKSDKTDHHPIDNDAKSLSRSPFCGLGAGNFWPKHGRQQILTMSSLLKKSPDDELSVFCVAAILVLNRSKFIKEINSMDDAIKIFNDMQFEIKVKRCIQMAIKLRKKYVHK